MTRREIKIPAPKSSQQSQPNNSPFSREEMNSLAPCFDFSALKRVNEELRNKITKRADQIKNLVATIMQLGGKRPENIRFDLNITVIDENLNAQNPSDQIATLQNQNRNLVALERKSNCRVAQLKNTIQQLQKQNKELAARVEKSDDVSASDISERNSSNPVDERDALIKQLEDKIEKLEVETSALVMGSKTRADLQKAQLLIIEQNKEITSLKAALLGRDSQIEQLTRKVDDLSWAQAAEQMMPSQIKIEALNDSIAILKASHDELAAVNANLEFQLQGVQHLLAEKGIETERLQAQLQQERNYSSQLRTLYANQQTNRVPNTTPYQHPNNPGAFFSAQPSVNGRSERTLNDPQHPYFLQSQQRGNELRAAKAAAAEEKRFREESAAAYSN
ncbi:MAG: hypothetical protein NTU49_09915 [Gammaproteobacteria bacterium]|nr:hypothetical protein [Gammaproteobacteria bacterium]